MKKLYEISLEVHAYAVGEDESEAIENFKREADRSALLDDDPEATLVENAIWADWMKAYPYGYDSDDTRTCGEWLADIREANRIRKEKEEWDKRQLKLC